MDKSKLTRERRLRRKRGLRKNLFGHTDKPRFTVFRSNQNIYAQIIDDVAGTTLAAADSLKIEKGSSMEAAEAVGKAVAEAAKSKGVDKVCFDRNGFRYHGRIKALADAAREAGLQF